MVADMVQQMGLTPDMADQLQKGQQGGMAGMGSGRGMVAPGLPTTPEEQMRLMEAAQNPHPPQPPQLTQQPIPEYVASESETESTASTESEVDLAHVG